MCSEGLDDEEDLSVTVHKLCSSSFKTCFLSAALQALYQMSLLSHCTVIFGNTAGLRRITNFHELIFSEAEYRKRTFFRFMKARVQIYNNFTS